MGLLRPLLGKLDLVSFAYLNLEWETNVQSVKENFAIIILINGENILITPCWPNEIFDIGTLLIHPLLKLAFNYCLNLKRLYDYISGYFEKLDYNGFFTRD